MYLSSFFRVLIFLGVLLQAFDLRFTMLVWRPRVGCTGAAARLAVFVCLCALLPCGTGAECTDSARIVRSSNAEENGYDNYAGHGDPFACKHGWMPKKTGSRVEHMGLYYDEYYCCEAECDDRKCTSPDGWGGRDCVANDEEGFTCSGGVAVRNTPHFMPEAVLAGKGFYRYTCCVWPEGEEPEIDGDGAAIVGIIVGAVVGLVALVGGIVACVCCCCMHDQRQTIVVQHIQPQPHALPMVAVASAPQAIAPPVAIPSAAAAHNNTQGGGAGSFCMHCGAQASGAFCGACGKPVNAAA